MKALLGVAPALATSAVRKSDLVAANIAGLAVGANPTALVGLAAINGVSTSWMRADAAPALDVTIAPTWTGAHTWTVATATNGLTANIAGTGIGFYANNTGSKYGFSTYNTSSGAGFYCNNVGTGPAISLIGAGPGITIASGGGFSSLQGASFAQNVTVAAPTSGQALTITGAAGSSALQLLATGMQVGAPTGGDKGAGTINVSGGFYVNGTLLATGGTAANPTGSVGLTAVNGSATTFLRSDGAPALSQAIAPTWTGTHTWTVAAAATGIVVGASGSGSSTGIYVGTSSTSAFAAAISVATSSNAYGIYAASSGSGSAINAAASSSGSAIVAFNSAGYPAINVTSGSISSAASATNAWQFDFTGGGNGSNNVTLTNGSTLTLPIGSGVAYIYENGGAAMCVAYLVFGIVYVTNIYGTLFGNTNGATGKINIYYNGNSYCITNNTGSTYTLCVSTMRLRSYT